jgi:CBS-domain-containing membrane protein
MHVEIRAAGDETVLIPQSVRQRLRRRCRRFIICSLLILVLLLLVPLGALAAVIFGHASGPLATGNNSLLARTIIAV